MALDYSSYSGFWNELFFKYAKMRNSSAMILGSFGMFLILRAVAIPSTPVSHRHHGGRI